MLSFQDPESYQSAFNSIEFSVFVLETTKDLQRTTDLIRRLQEPSMQRELDNLVFLQSGMMVGLEFDQFVHRATKDLAVRELLVLVLRFKNRNLDKGMGDERVREMSLKELKFKRRKKIC